MFATVTKPGVTLGLAYVEAFLYATASCTRQRRRSSFAFSVNFMRHENTMFIQKLEGLYVEVPSFMNSSIIESHQKLRRRPSKFRLSGNSVDVGS